MTTEEAHQLLSRNLKNPNLVKHCLATKASMKALYRRLNPDFKKEEEEKWALVGLLHDIDYEMAKGQPEKHGLLFFDKEPGVIPLEIETAIKAHNPQTGIEAKKPMEWAIRCVDQLTGIIVAAALVHPDKKISSINTDFVLNRFKEKSFARGAHRQSILLCEEKLGLPLKEFVDITLKAMQDISESLEL